MDSYEASLDEVAAEKAIAMRKYRRHQHLKTVLKACVVLAPLLFALSRSSTLLSAATKLSGHLSREIQAVFDNRFYVFALVMAILFAVAALCSQNDGGEDDSGVAGAARLPDIYEEFAINSAYCRDMPFSGGPYRETEMTPYCRNNVIDVAEATVAEEQTVVEKQMICSENAVAPFPTVVEIETAETVTKRDSGCVPPLRAITMDCDVEPLQEKEKEKEKEKKEKRYTRTQSESFEKNRAAEKFETRKNRVMKRSETEIHRKMSSREQRARWSSSVEELNNEEFNRQIQDFILKNKMKQKEEIESDKRRRRIEGNNMKFF